MFSRILVPLDGTPFAEWALPTAVALARQTGGIVRLVSVVDKPPVFVYPEAPDPDRDRMREYLTSVMNRILLLCPGSVDLAVREGRPVLEIEAEAAEWKADVVVMSTHGRAGFARLWNGSVAARCAETGACPVLLVRPPEADSPDLDHFPCVARIVVPLDGSELAERALDAAAGLARAFGVHVLLLSVRPDPLGTDRSPAYEYDEVDDPTRSAVLTYLKTQVARLRKSGIHSYGMLLSEPDAAETIADRVRGDLLVMATHGHERIRRTLLGTVTDRVVRDANCAVMVIPPLHTEAARNAKSA
jgi:nucleotide-binding universal stress UspA family protein